SGRALIISVYTSVSSVAFLAAPRRRVRAVLGQRLIARGFNQPPPTSIDALPTPTRDTLAVD
ncbi:MAG TPA: hypothetical protein VIP98_18370, partial [Microlunatus sp.]